MLELGTKYEMKDVCKVAVLALDSANALGPVQRVRLYDQHGINSSFLASTLSTIYRRPESLTPQEAEELGYARTMEIVKHREDIMRAELEAVR